MKIKIPEKCKDCQFWCTIPSIEVNLKVYYCKIFKRNLYMLNLKPSFCDIDYFIGVKENEK